MERLNSAAEELFQHTALVLAQEFMFTEFDWRVGILDGQALYACQYFMSRGHWQIYNHGANAPQRSGGFKTLPVRDAPSEVVKLALKATTPIGDGLYGVDLKQVGERTVVIEMNDNPSIDAGSGMPIGEACIAASWAEFLRRMEESAWGPDGGGRRHSPHHASTLQALRLTCRPAAATRTGPGSGANATIQRRRRKARSSAGATISQNGSQPNQGSMPRIAGTKTTAAQPAISQTCKAVIHVANSGVAGSKGMRGEAAIMTALRSSCRQASHA